MFHAEWERLIPNVSVVAEHEAVPASCNGETFDVSGAECCSCRDSLGEAPLGRCKFDTCEARGYGIENAEFYSFAGLRENRRAEDILDFGKSLCSNLVFPVLTNVESMSVSMTTSIHLIFFIISSALLISRLVTGRTLL